MNLKILKKLWQWLLFTNDRNFPKTISAVQTCNQISFHETRKTSSAARPSVPFFLLPQKLVECRSFNYSNEVQFVWSWYDGYIIGPSERFFHFESGMPQEKVGGGLWQGLWQKYAPEITELHFSFHRVCGPSSLSPLSLSLSGEIRTAILHSEHSQMAWLPVFVWNHQSHQISCATLGWVLGILSSNPFVNIGVRSEIENIGFPINRRFLTFESFWRKSAVKSRFHGASLNTWDLIAKTRALVKAFYKQNPPAPSLKNS